MAGGAVFVAALALAVRKAARRRGAPDASHRFAWRFDHQFDSLPAGSTLRIELSSPALVHWTADQWDSVEDTHTREVAPGAHIAELATEALPPGVRLHFTFYWPDVKRWEGEDFDIRIEAAGGDAARAASD